MRSCWSWPTSRTCLMLWALGSWRVCSGCQRCGSAAGACCATKAEGMKCAALRCASWGPAMVKADEAAGCRAAPLAVSVSSSRQGGPCILAINTSVPRAVHVHMHSLLLPLLHLQARARLLRTLRRGAGGGPGLAGAGGMGRQEELILHTSPPSSCLLLLSLGESRASSRGFCDPLQFAAHTWRSLLRRMASTTTTALCSLAPAKLEPVP